MNTPPPQFPASQRSSYQFPVYKWIGWLTVGGFAIGLTAMFFIAGMFGWPAPILWASMVVLFSFGALLLDRPKLLLLVMMFYFLAVPGNRLLGIFPIPLLGGMNKYFFLPLIAVIAMNWIQRRQLDQATLFPMAFLSLTVMSWYVNGKPSIVVTIQATLVMMRLYILWYYCRLTSTFENDRQAMRWVWGYIIYVAIQFAYNTLWHGRPWLRLHPDRSGGVFGPMSIAGSHHVGYMSVFALLMLVGWWMGSALKASARQKGFMIFLGVIIAYNLIFMTDTKHALFLMPVAFAPFLFHPRFPRQAKVALVSGALAFLFAAMAYLQTASGGRDVRRYWEAFQNSPKADMLYAVTVDFNHLVRYPILGAGPGLFASTAAVEARAALARRYIIPHLDENRRRGYFFAQGSMSSASVIGNPQSDVLIMTSEYGWAGTVVFFIFWGWVIYQLFKKAFVHPATSERAGILLALACCLIFQAMIMGLTELLILPPLVYPIWMLVGRMWDMKPVPQELSEAA